MDFKFDSYTWRARVLPVYLTAAPAVMVISATLPEGLNLPLAGASAIVFMPLSYFMSQVASDFGKKLEPTFGALGVAHQPPGFSVTTTTSSTPKHVIASITEARFVPSCFPSGAI